MTFSDELQASWSLIVYHIETRTCVIDSQTMSVIFTVLERERERQTERERLCMHSAVTSPAHQHVDDKLQLDVTQHVRDDVTKHKVNVKVKVTLVTY